MDDMEVKIDTRALYEFVGDHDEEVIGEVTKQINDRASSMSAGFKSGIRHDPKTRERQGGTPAKYDSNVKKFKGVHVGLVFTGNYAALKDNNQNNTLLKALG